MALHAMQKIQQIFILRANIIRRRARYGKILTAAQVIFNLSELRTSSCCRSEPYTSKMYKGDRSFNNVTTTVTPQGRPGVFGSKTQSRSVLVPGSAIILARPERGQALASPGFAVTVAQAAPSSLAGPLTSIQRRFLLSAYARGQGTVIAYPSESPEPI